MNKISQYSKGFTLAEVLLTLAIIGTVAALTITQLLYNFQKTQWSTGLRKAYTDLSAATNSIKNDNGGTLVDLFWDASKPSPYAEDQMLDLYAAKMNFVKKCYMTQNTGGDVCWVKDSSVKDLYGANWAENINSSYARAVASNGAFYAFGYTSDDCSNCQFKYNGVNITCGFVYVDINGLKPPNKMGRDIFSFYITQNGIYPKTILGSTHGACLENNETDLSNSCNPAIDLSGWGGWGCAGKVAREGWQMNY